MDTACLEPAWSSEKANKVSLELRDCWAFLKSWQAARGFIPQLSPSSGEGLSAQGCVVAEPLGIGETSATFRTEGKPVC